MWLLFVTVLLSSHSAIQAAPTEIHLEIPLVATKEELQWFKQIMSIIRDNSLTKQQRMEKIRTVPANQSSAEWESDLEDISKTVDLFDWFYAEKQKTSGAVRNVFEKVAELMFETDFLSKTSAEQTEDLQSMSKLGETLSKSDAILLLNLLQKFEDKIDELGLDNSSFIKTST